MLVQKATCSERGVAIFEIVFLSEGERSVVLTPVIPALARWRRGIESLSQPGLHKETVSKIKSASLHIHGYVRLYL
jgi:hypothetical protein